MPGAEQWLYETEKSSHQRFSIKTLFLKILQDSQENTCVKFLRTPIFEEHLRMAASELTLLSDSL